jgi:electron transfer flavoprotein beta subunit
MKVRVPVKRVIDPYAKVKANAEGNGIDTTGVKFEINPFDEIAVEEAVRQKEKNPAITITVVSVGPDAAEEQLRKALAIGADEAVLIQTDEDLDSRAVAHELAAFAQELQPQLILMGKQATDNDANQAGQRLAAKLGWPQATFACAVEFAGDNLTVRRETDEGEETLSLPLPAVVTTDLRLNEPRYIALPGIIKARSKPLTKRPRLTDVKSQVRTVKVEQPAPRQAGVRVNSVAELMAALRDRGAL